MGYKEIKEVIEEKKAKRRFFLKAGLDKDSKTIKRLEYELGCIYKLLGWL